MVWFVGEDLDEDLGDGREDRYMPTYIGRLALHR